MIGCATLPVCLSSENKNTNFAPQPAAARKRDLNNFSLICPTAMRTELLVLEFSKNVLKYSLMCVFKKEKENKIKKKKHTRGKLVLYYYLSRQMSCLFSTIYYSKDSDVVVVLTSENTSHNRTHCSGRIWETEEPWCWELTDVCTAGRDLFWADASWRISHSAYIQKTFAHKIYNTELQTTK